MPVIPRENYLLRIVTLLRQPLYKPYLFGACLYAFAQWSKTLYKNQCSYFVSWYLKFLQRFFILAGQAEGLGVRITVSVLFLESRLHADKFDGSSLFA